MRGEQKVASSFACVFSLVDDLLFCVIELCSGYCGEANAFDVVPSTSMGGEALHEVHGLPDVFFAVVEAEDVDPCGQGVR